MASAAIDTLGLWRITRSDAARAAYDWLAEHGVRIAQLDRFERGTHDAGGTGLAAAPTTVRASGDRAAAGYPARLRDAPIAPDDRILYARVHGRVVGSVVLSRRPVYVPALGRRLDPPGVYCWGLNVRPAHRNRGIGTGLIGEAVRWARRQPDVERVSALVAPDNTLSRRAFAASGFEPTGRHTVLEVGGWRRHNRREL